MLVVVIRSIRWLSTAKLVIHVLVAIPWRAMQWERGRQLSAGQFAQQVNIESMERRIVQEWQRQRADLGKDTAAAPHLTSRFLLAAQLTMLHAQCAKQGNLNSRWEQIHAGMCCERSSVNEVLFFLLFSIDNILIYLFGFLVFSHSFFLLVVVFSFCLLLLLLLPCFTFSFVVCAQLAKYLPAPETSSARFVPSVVTSIPKDKLLARPCIYSLD